MSMGLLPKHIHLLAMNQVAHSVAGHVLTFGQQAVYATLPEVVKIVKQHTDRIHPVDEDADTKNRIPGWVGTPLGLHTNAQTVLKLLGAADVSVLDVSEYERPDIVADLNLAVPDRYHDRFDYILDVGTLEHVFDVPAALDNMVKMLKVGGTVTLVMPTSNAIDHGFYSFSPTLFFDYFAANGFDDFSCYLLEGSCFNYMKKGNVYSYKDVGREYCFTSRHMVEIYFSATKTKSMAHAVRPIQSIYARSKEWKSTPAAGSNDPVVKDDHGLWMNIKRMKWLLKERLRRNRYRYNNRKSRNIKLVGRY
jgi:hypothetical protein